MDKGINELFLSKCITICITHRGKTKNISYVIDGVFGNNDYKEFSLKSKKYPCEIKNMENITLKVSK